MTPILAGQWRWWCSPCMAGLNEGPQMSKAKPPVEKSPAELLRMELDKKKEEGLRLRDVKVYHFPESKVVELMTTTRLKQAHISSHTGVPAHFISSAMKGENVRLDVAVRLAKFFGRSVEELFGEPEDGPPPEPKKAEASPTVEQPPTDELFEESGETQEAHAYQR